MSDPFLRVAIELGRLALGVVAPRPPVGAVVVKDGRVLGSGRTEARPGRHAEAAALVEAGAGAVGATLYCSLEPHGFRGVSPPCTGAIIGAGIRRVVCPLEDPNPSVSGRGFAELRSAGVEVSRECSDADWDGARELIEGYVKHMGTGFPFVTAKFAMSLDGKIATRRGSSRWITGAEARAAAHVMRGSADAVAVGAGTVAADDPRLTARDGEGRATGRPRLRVVVDTGGRASLDSRVFTEPGAVLWAVGEGAGARSPRPGVEVVELGRAGGGVDLGSLVGLLGRRDVHNVLFEGGGALLGGLFDLGLVDKVAAFVAPVILGGRDAPGPVGGVGVGEVSDGFSLDGVRRVQLGRDTLISGYVRGLGGL